MKTLFATTGRGARSVGWMPGGGLRTALFLLPLWMSVVTVHGGDFFSTFGKLSIFKLENCTAHRTALKEDYPVEYHSLLKNTKLQLQAITVAARANGVLSSSSIESWVANPGDSDGSGGEQAAYYTFGAIKYIIPFLVPTSFLSILADLTRVVCHGREQEVKEEGWLLEHFPLLAHLSNLFSKATLNINNYNRGLSYKQFNGGPFFRVLSWMQERLDTAEEAGKLMGKVPLHPIRTFSKGLVTIIRVPGALAKKGVEKMNLWCEKNGYMEKFDYAAWVLDLLETIRSVLGMLFTAFGLAVKSFNFVFDESYKELMDKIEEDRPELGHCEALDEDVPSGLPFEESKYYKEKVEDIKRYIEDLGEVVTWEDISGNFEVTQAREQQEANFDFADGLLDAFQAFDDNLFNALHFDGFDEFMETIFIDLPQSMEAFTSVVGPIRGDLEPIMDIIQTVLDVIPDIPEVPFLSFIEDVICGVVDCGFLENLLGPLIEELLAPLNIPDIDTQVLDLTTKFDVVFGDLINGDLSKLIPDLSFADFFDPEIAFDKLASFYSPYKVLPHHVHMEYYTPPELAGTDKEILPKFFWAENNKTAEIACDSGSTPVVTSAIYSTKNHACRQNLTPKFRFPCDEGKSKCTIDSTPYVSCQIDFDPLLNGFLEIPAEEFEVRYLCFENIDDFKFVPFNTRVHTGAYIEDLQPTITTKYWTQPSDPWDLARIWEVQVSENDDYATAVANENTAFNRIRGAWYRTTHTVKQFECSTTRQMRAFPVYIHKEIEPCLNGYSFPTSNYDSDLCVWKALFDHDLISEPDDCSHQTLVGQNKGGSAIDYHNLDDFHGVCNRDPSKCDSSGNCDDIVLDWETIALNVEVCDVAYIENANGALEFCPFYNNVMVPVSEHLKQSVSYHMYPLHRACWGDIIDSPYETGTPPMFTMAQDAYFYEGKSFFDCDLRQQLEDSLVLPDGHKFNSPYRGWKDKALDDPTRLDGTSYGDWLSKSEELNDMCWGTNGSEGELEKCMREGKCNFNTLKCMPNYMAYACAVDPTSTEISRTYLFDYSASGREVSLETKDLVCGSDVVIVDGVSTTIQRELIIESLLEASTSDLFDWVDKTDILEAYCNIDQQVTSCSLDPTETLSDGTRAHPLNGYIWEIDTQCLCPVGFNRFPEDGSCVPCHAGYYRSLSLTECSSCPQGQYSVEGSSQCTLCPEGTYQGERASAPVNTTICDICPVGSFCPDEGSAQSILCLPGQYQDLVGQTSCKDPDPGYYVPERGSTFQTLIPAGYQRYGPSQSVLEQCDTGKYSKEGDWFCTPCPLGFYAIKKGSKTCVPCGQGYYSDVLGQETCTKCGFGLTTRQSGSTRFSDCVPVPDQIEIQSIHQLGSSPDYLTAEMIALADNGNTQRIADVSLGCQAILMDYVEDVDDSNLEEALSEIGNGFCNRGPWNTEACGWDGGDCCPHSCHPMVEEGDTEVEIAAAVAVGSCFWNNFQCRDPAWLQETINSTECDPMIALTGGVEQPPIRRTRRLPIIYDARVGNGVCDPDLNNLLDNYDGGDCCPHTCEHNPAYAESCSPRSFLVPLGIVVMEGFNCDLETGFWYGCQDPDVDQEGYFYLSDTAPPLIHVVSDYEVICQEELPGQLLQNSVESPFEVIVTDNDPCFNPNTKVTFVSEAITDETGDAVGVEFHYTASDIANNIGSTSVKVMLANNGPYPIMHGCPLRTHSIDVAVQPGDTTIQLPLIYATDYCDDAIEIPVQYSSNTLSALGATFDDATGVVTLNSGFTGVADHSFDVSVVVPSKPELDCNFVVHLEFYPEAKCVNFVQINQPSAFDAVSFESVEELKTYLDDGSSSVDGSELTYGFSLLSGPNELGPFRATNALSSFFTMSVTNENNGLTDECHAAFRVAA